nr:proline-rich receptor-like protein kinase PERK10 [Aedes albopictus]
MKQPVQIPDVTKRPSTSSLVEQLPSPFPPDEIKPKQPVSDDIPKEKIPVNDPANVQSNDDLTEVINPETAPTPGKLPSVTTNVQKCHRTGKPTLRERTPTNHESKATHRITPKIKPSRTAPRVPPNPKRSLLHQEIPQKKQPVPKSAGSSPSTESALASTGAHPVFKPSQFHADLKPKKPPDGQPMHQPSEVIRECVSRTHPSRNPEEDAQYNLHLPSAPACGPKPRSLNLLLGSSTKSPTTPKISTHQKIPSSGCPPAPHAQLNPPA